MNINEVCVKAQAALAETWMNVLVGQTNARTDKLVELSYLGPMNVYLLMFK